VHSGRLDGVVCRAHGVNADVGVLQGHRVVSCPSARASPWTMSSVCVGARRCWWRRETWWFAVYMRGEGGVHGLGDQVLGIDGFSPPLALLVLW
jgi:hypothetical protein